MKHVIKVSHVDSRKKELTSLYIDHLKRRMYSRHTIKNYAFHPGRFLEFTGDRPPDADAVVRFINHLTADKEVNSSCRHMALNAILLIYSAGLRLSESVELKLQDKVRLRFTA